MPNYVLPLVIGGAILLAAIAIAVALAARMARAFLRGPTRRPEARPEALGLRGEPFAIPTAGGAVRGWLLHGEGQRDARLLVVAAHGWAASASDMLAWVRPIVEAGHDVVVYDVLGHGVSDARELSSIRHFVDDLRVVVDWARVRASGRMALFGHSLGGAAAIVVAAESSDVAGVLVAAAPTDAIEVTREWLEARGRPAGLLIALMRPFWRSIVRVPYESLIPVRRIAAVRAPILILHGEADRQVSTRHARELAAAQPAARLELFEGADHFSIPKDPRYGPIVAGFLAAIGAR